VRGTYASTGTEVLIFAEEIYLYVLPPATLANSFSMTSQVHGTHIQWNRNFKMFLKDYSLQEWTNGRLSVETIVTDENYKIFSF
jgi:hypothetical protein